MHTRRLALAILLLSLATLFCTLRPSGLLSGPSGPISDDQRIATLDKITEVVDRSVLPDGRVDKTALLRYLESTPEFEASGEAPDGSVWARFGDGRLVIFPPYVPPSAEHETAPPPTPGPVSLSPAVPRSSDLQTSFPAPDASAQDGKALSALLPQGGEQGNLPASDTAVVMRALGGGFANSVPSIKAWLKAHGYSLGADDPSVENLKAIQDVGVFYFDTHGGTACKGTREACQARATPGAPTPRPSAAPSVSYTYALWTSTPVTAASDAAYRADLDAGLLAYMLAESRYRGPNEWRYAITADFIKVKMRFSKDSLVFIDACGSASGGLGPALTEAKASVFVGWTAPTTSADRPRYFFDRLLGINDASGYRNVPKPEPPNRPFDYDKIWSTMNGLGTVEIAPAEAGSLTASTMLVTEKLGGSFAILRPTIERLIVHEDKNELEIKGLFGDEQGLVTIGGAQAAVQKWTADTIRVKLPAADQSGGSGDVVVKVRKHESNAVPLTMWHIKFTYTEGPDIIGGYHYLRYDVYLRADVHRYRTQPDSEPEDQAAQDVQAADGSTAEWQCDWSGALSGVSVSAGSSGKIPLTRDSVSVSGFSVKARLDPKKHAFQDLSIPTYTAPDSICPTHVSGGGVSFDTYTDFTFLPVLAGEPEPPVKQMSLDDSWAIAKAKIALVLPGTWPWLEWGKIDPEAAPIEKETKAWLPPSGIVLLTPDTVPAPSS